MDLYSQINDGVPSMYVKGWPLFLRKAVVRHAILTKLKGEKKRIKNLNADEGMDLDLGKLTVAKSLKCPSILSFSPCVFLPRPL